MKIRFADIDLTGDAMPERPKNITINGQLLTQPGRFLRGTQRRMFNRNNKGTTITFEIAREHASQIAAEDYLLIHSAGLPESGLCRLTAEDPELDIARNFDLENATLSADTSRQVGVTTVHTYTIEGGKIIRET